MCDFDDAASLGERQQFWHFLRNNNPGELESGELQDFLSYLAVEGRISSVTQSQTRLAKMNSADSQQFVTLYHANVSHYFCPPND